MFNISECEEDIWITSEGYTLTSPNYPDQFFNPSTCIWILRSTLGNNIRIYSDNDLNSNTDNVEMGIGDQPSLSTKIDMIWLHATQDQFKIDTYASVVWVAFVVSYFPTSEVFKMEVFETDSNSTCKYLGQRFSV